MALNPVGEAHKLSRLMAAIAACFDEGPPATTVDIEVYRRAAQKALTHIRHYKQYRRSIEGVR